MTNDRIRDLIEENYSLSIIKIEKVKSAYKITAEEGRYCLKVVKYQYPHFCFIQEVMLHLQRNGFNNIPGFVVTKDKKTYIDFGENFAYVTKWVTSRESNYDNPIELYKVSKLLGELHKAGKGFTCNKNVIPRIGWGSWIDVFKTRNNEILDFKKRIGQKAIKDEFDIAYLRIMEEELERGEKSIFGLEKCGYRDVMRNEVMGRGICHHDLANHNILVDKNNKFHIIDFDYCMLDSHLHDLSSLIIRALKGGKWEEKKVNLIIGGYEEVFPILNVEYLLMREFIRYPQSYWQLGLQRYWEQQPWDIEKFLSRLRNYMEDREEREEFINSYFKGGD